MKLSIRHGKFLQLSEIPAKAHIRTLKYGHLPLFLINKLYRTCIDGLSSRHCRCTVDYDLDELPYSTVEEALNSFEVFNIVDDVEKVIVNNIKIGITKPLPVYVDMSEYFSCFANNYFRFRHEQSDCYYVIDAFNNELHRFVSQADLHVEVPYTPKISLRTATHDPLIIPNTSRAIKEIKEKLNNCSEYLQKIIYELQTIVLKINYKKPPLPEHDFEL